MDTDRVTSWLNDNAVKIASTEPGVDLPDLQAVGRMLGGVRVVGFGQVSHGTRELMEVHHRYTRHLIERMGFNVVAVECSNSAASLVNDYVLGGPGILEGLVSGLGQAMWDVEEFVAFVKWLRRHNRAPSVAGPVRFLGLDLFPSRVSRERVLERLQAMAPAHLEDVRPILAALERGETRGVLHVHRYLDPTMARTLMRVRQVIRGRRAATEAMPDELSALDHDLSLLFQWMDANRIRPDRAGASGLDIHARSLSMARLLEAFLAQQGERTRAVIWAHNIHVGLEYQESETAPREMLGTRLRERFGAAYYSFGSEVSQGCYLARRWAEGQTLGELIVAELSPAGPGALGWRLAQLDAPDVILDFRYARKTPAAKTWLATPLETRGLGWAHNDPPIPTKVTLGTTYDGLIAFRSSTPTTPTPNVVSAVRARTTY